MNEKELLSRITINPEICHGKPTIRNKRYMVEVILDLLSSGMTNQEILEDYPELQNEDILACLALAAKILRVKSYANILGWGFWLMHTLHICSMMCCIKKITMLCMWSSCQKAMIRPIRSSLSCWFGEPDSNYQRFWFLLFSHFNRKTTQITAD